MNKKLRDEIMKAIAKSDLHESIDPLVDLFTKHLSDFGEEIRMEEIEVCFKHAKGERCDHCETYNKAVKEINKRIDKYMKGVK